MFVSIFVQVRCISQLMVFWECRKMTSMKRLLILSIILLLSTPAYAQTYTVERVIDGDTLKLTNGERDRKDTI